MHTTQYVCICVCVCIKCSNHQTINSKWTPSLVARFVAHFHVERVKKPAPHHTHSHTHSHALSLARSCTQLLSLSVCMPHAQLPCNEMEMEHRETLCMAILILPAAHDLPGCHQPLLWAWLVFPLNCASLKLRGEVNCELCAHCLLPGLITF